VAKIVHPQARLADLLSLAMASYAFDATLLPRESLIALLGVLDKGDHQTVNKLLVAAGVATPVGVRCLMWLWKFDLVQVVQAFQVDQLVPAPPAV
jgi:hypothetical protein